MVEGQFSSQLPARPLLLLLLAAPVTLAVVSCEGGRAGPVLTTRKTVQISQNTGKIQHRN